MVNPPIFSSLSILPLAPPLLFFFPQPTLHFFSSLITHSTLNTHTHRAPHFSSSSLFFIFFCLRTPTSSTHQPTPYIYIYIYIYIYSFSPLPLLPPHPLISFFLFFFFFIFHFIYLFIYLFDFPN
ncbi:unnamed protein product, partial [Vitis vinifera]